ncbi:MAG TPA: YciI family protein [Kofleriaceae bacterium]|nr:YciI family protein [Kofleriaceae bacterium]
MSSSREAQSKQPRRLPLPRSAVQKRDVFDRGYERLVHDKHSTDVQWPGCRPGDPSCSHELPLADRAPARPRKIARAVSIRCAADRRPGRTGPYPVVTGRPAAIRKDHAMRFMMLMYPGAKAETGALPDPAAVAPMMKYNEELARAGVLLAGDGLHPTSKGVRVRASGGKRSITDGPFSEAKELIGGYWMIQVRSKEEAVEWASRVPLADDEMVELRQVYEMEEFPAEIQELAAPVIDARAQK